ncbi:MAG: nucleotide exchange factor GrpE [Hyphomicrobiaceae bacterium]|nr:nucleotide exchange factor GrpE [Hyphomicrobiaceae bacterium]
MSDEPKASAAADGAPDASRPAPEAASTATPPDEATPAPSTEASAASPSGEAVTAAEALEAIEAAMAAEDAGYVRKIAELERQIGDLTDRLVRAHAEIQNLHRRRERDVADAAKYAISKFAGDTVGIADNFERALGAVPAGAANDNPMLRALVEGVSMTEREFFNVLEKHGVKRIKPMGEPFDPHQHQAVMEQEDRAVPAGTVLMVYQSGYIIGERVLRPAMVVVSRGGPRPVREPVAEAAANGPGDSEPKASDDGAASSTPHGTT